MAKHSHFDALANSFASAASDTREKAVEQPEPEQAASSQPPEQQLSTTPTTGARPLSFDQLAAQHAKAPSPEPEPDIDHERDR